VEAIVALQAELGGPPCWVSFQCRSGSELADGTPLLEAVAAVREVAGIRAVGTNCVKPEFVEEIVRACRAAAPSLAVVVYPNDDGRGEWDAEKKEWGKKGTGGFPAETVRRWRDAGANLIGT